MTIFYQSFTIGLLGFFVGVGISRVLAAVLNEYVPQFVTEFWPKDLLLTFGLTLLMSIISGYLPARRIGKIDPATVFKV